jgi:hypothetical protein
MKDKELRQILIKSDLISVDKEGIIEKFFWEDDDPNNFPWKITTSLPFKIKKMGNKIKDQQDKLDFILNHLNLNIEKFQGYVETKLDK